MKAVRRAEVKEAKTANNTIKHAAEQAIWLTMYEEEGDEFPTVYLNGDGVFRIIKQMGHTDQDVIRENCIHNDAGELALTNEDKTTAWVEQSQVWVAKWWALWGVSNYWPPLYCKPDLDLHRTRQNVMQQTLLAHMASSLRCQTLLVRKELSWRATGGSYFKQ